MKWIARAVILLVGITFGFIGREFLSVTFKNEFDIAHVLTIILTIIVAALLQYHAIARRGDARAEKDLLIEQVKEIIETASEVRKRFLTCFHTRTTSEEDFRFIKTALKNWSSSMSMLEDALQDCNMSKEKAALGIVKYQFFEYKRVLTGGVYLAPYSDYAFNSSELTFKRLRSQLQVLMRQINRH